MADAQVDVAIPTHGEGRWLAEAIDSVLSQTYRTLTLRISDNGPGGGSTEALVTRLRQQDPRIEHTATGGVSMVDNWNRCIQFGDGTYVTLLPHDETWAPEWLERRVAFLEAHPECAFVFSAYSFMDENDQIIAEPEHRFTEGVHQPRDFVPKLYMNNEIAPGSILMRRSALEAVGGTYLGEYRMGYDWELYMRMAVRSPVGYLAVRDNVGRWHSESGTSQASRWGAMHVTMTRRNDELIAKHMNGWQLPGRARARRLEYAHLKAALDVVEQGDEAGARRHVRAAVRASGHALVNPRTYVALAGSVGGEPLRRAVSKIRELEGRAQIGNRANELALKAKARARAARSR
jgi:glycosyltransferase involved in cell wall biosynthesis